MRLIDADALIKDITNSADLGGELGKVVEVVKAYTKFMVATAPTIQTAQPEPIRLRLDHELSKEEYEKLKKDCAEQLIILLPKESAPQWIPCSDRLPEEPYGCLVTVWDTNPITMDEFENILPYFVGWDGEQWNDADGEQCPFEVIAWMPLPEPYKEGIE